MENADRAAGQGVHTGIKRQKNGFEKKRRVYNSTFLLHV